MNEAEKEYINMHALLIQKLLSDYEVTAMTFQDLAVAIRNHTDLIIDVAAKGGQNPWKSLLN